MKPKLDTGLKNKRMPIGKMVKQVKQAQSEIIADRDNGKQINIARVKLKPLKEKVSVHDRLYGQ